MAKKTKQKAVIAIAAVFLFLSFFVLSLEIVNLNKIAYGAKIGGVDVGGKTTQEAEKILKEKFSEWQKKKIKFAYQNQKFYASPDELGIKLDLVQTTNSAFNFGRSKNIFIGLWEQASALIGLIKADLPAIYAADKDVFENFAKNNFAPFENPAKNASLAYNFKTRGWEITPSSEGMIFDRQKISDGLEKNISRLSNESIELVLIKDIPEVLENEIEAAKKQTDEIIASAPFIIKYNSESNNGKEMNWEIDKNTLISWLEFIPVEEKLSSNVEIKNNFSIWTKKLILGNATSNTQPNKILGVSLNQEKIQDVLAEIALAINQEAINAQLIFKENRVETFALPQIGIKLEIDESAERISNKILSGDTAQKEIELIVVKTQPLINNESIQNLGLISLLGAGTSNFTGSPQNRMHNIKIGAAKINGFLVGPGEEFSFSKVVGEIGPQQGYLPELVIKKNKTIPEYGGGICQVSTTIFRAAVNSGLKITERYPHAFPVKYYNPQGFDATVYPPRPNLKFINDTPKNILLQSKIEGTKISFEIYGTNDGREVKIKGPTILSAAEDGSMKTILYQQIWKNGQMEREDKFYSNYKSPALYPIEKNPLE